MGMVRSIQGVLILLGTFVLEDAATILAAMDVQVGQVTLVVALVALYVGIVLGDIGLYGLGRLAVTTPWARRWAPPERFGRSRDWLRTHVIKIVFISRFLPGARLPDLHRMRLFPGRPAPVRAWRRSAPR